MYFRVFKAIFFSLMVLVGCDGGGTVNGNIKKLDVVASTLPVPAVVSSATDEPIGLGAIPPHTSLSGVAQKGNFTIGSQIKALHLEFGVLTGLEASMKIKDEIDGWKLVVPWEDITALGVTGRYFNECNGEYSDLPLTLRSYADGRSGASINLYTHLVYARTNYLLDKKSVAFSAAWDQAIREVQRLFSFSALPTKLDLNDGSSELSQYNAGLLLFSAAFSCFEDSQNLLIGLEKDFADNGLIDGGASQKFKQIRVQAGEQGFLDKIRNNLIKIGVTNPPNQSDFSDNKLPDWAIVRGE